MAELKTKQTTASASDFLKSIDDDEKRSDCRKITAMMRKATSAKPRMWGACTVGFGAYRYRHASGREGTWPLVAFAPGKRNITLYIMPGLSNFDKLTSRLGRYEAGKSCLYIRTLDDVDVGKLKVLIEGSVKYINKYSLA